MKTKNNTLEFGKSSITELNENQVIGVNGGCQQSNSSAGPVIKISIIKQDDVIAL